VPNGVESKRAGGNRRVLKVDEEQPALLGLRPMTVRKEVSDFEALMHRAHCLDVVALQADPGKLFIHALLCPVEALGFAALAKHVLNGLMLVGNTVRPDLLTGLRRGTRGVGRPDAEREQEF